MWRDKCNFTLGMIITFRHKGLRQLWEMGNGMRLPSEQVPRTERMLEVIDALQEVPGDLEVYKNWHIDKLSGKLKGFWALKVSGNYRLIFRFEGFNAYDLDYVDYH